MFLHLGANLGIYSLLAAQLRHSASDHRPERVIAVDGAGDNLAYISHSLISNKISSPLVTLVHNAISDLSEPLYPVPGDQLPNIVGDPNTNPGARQFLRRKEIGQRKILGAPISPITMRNLFDAIPPATLIVKMDIQGHECRALRSLGQFPASHPTPYIFMEWFEIHDQKRWPTNLAVMTDHCLHGPSNDILWVHESARPIWDKADDKVVECTYNPEWKPSDPVLDGHCI